MTIWWLAFILGSLAALCAAFIWIAVRLNRLQADRGSQKTLGETYADMAEEETAHLFNKEFREELRNRGRLRFEKIIDENAMFMKQDLDLTVSQLNEYMKQQVSQKLDTGFDAYTKAMQEAQELALGSLQKTAEEVEAQRTKLSNTLKEDVAAREAALLKVYEQNMAEIIEHYVLQSLGEALDMKAQLPYIMKQLEASKEDIIKDMQL
jgi:hypothetical protein